MCVDSWMSYNSWKQFAQTKGRFARSLNPHAHIPLDIKQYIHSLILWNPGNFIVRTKNFSILSRSCYTRWVLWLLVSLIMIILVLWHTYVYNIYIHMCLYANLQNETEISVFSRRCAGVGRRVTLSKRMLIGCLTSRYGWRVFINIM